MPVTVFSPPTMPHVLKDPTAVTAGSLDTSKWFVPEETTYTVPGPNSAAEDNLAWYIAQGWVSTSMTGSGTEASPYVHTLERYRLDSQKVMTDLVPQYVAAYNEGREANDSRYDDVVGLLLSLQVANTADANVIDSQEVAIATLIDQVVTGMQAGFDTYVSDAVSLIGTFGTSRRAAINTRFDAKLTEASQGLLDRGMYNTTVLDSLTAGVEREREAALTEVSDAIIQQDAANVDRIQARRMEVQANIIGARDRLQARRTATQMGALDQRNSLLLALTSFMEARTDSYPDLSALAGIATQLGANDASGAVPTGAAP